MSNHLYLDAPLDIDGWEIVEPLENLELYEEFSERIDDALELIREGQHYWASHQEDGAWSAESKRVMTEVRRLSYNIRQTFNRSQDDLPRCIRWTIGELSESAVTDCQCVAAFAIDRACRAIEVLARWMADFDTDLYTVGRDTLATLAKDKPKSFNIFLNEVRHEQAQQEIEARENVADLMGVARYYMTLASVYASPLLSSSEKIRISAATSKAGKSSAKIRKENTADRDRSICSHGKRLLNDGRSRRELVGIIAGTDSALKQPGGSVKLSKKQLRNILVTGGVLI
ncbi:hypothetical protein [Pseudomonas piscis]|uniref:hypothetical protein n=1 Tax=Pseudomonas piscis TaxID=2614538 RepID=UPI0021D5B9B5|nr:hypothetical protein [Pseudomonas piscis]MCU7650737.1 hypothetical protein [Pseudomonas piscis]